MTVLAALTTWEEFTVLPDAESGARYELHDGEVILVPPPRPVHIYIQGLLAQWLTVATQGVGSAAQEFPYRPAKNLQFWYADVAYVPNEDWQTMRGAEYPIYAPPLIIEVLSPSNKEAEISRQRIAAFSGGTREFWLVDPERKQIIKSLPSAPSQIFLANERLPVSVLPGLSLVVASLFE